MNPRILQYLQNALLTAVTVVLALVVLSAFLRIIRSPEPATTGAALGGSASVTSIAAAEGGSVPTATNDDPDPGVTSTVALSGDEPICREPIPPAGSGTLLRVFYHCGNSLVPNPDTFVYREVPDTDLVLTTTLEQMVSGPDADEAALGFDSVFSEATTRSFASVRIESGRAVIDFTGLETIDDLSTPTAADFFLANLGANVFQFDTISSVEYRLGGSCEAFYALLARECRIETRQSWNQQVAEWRNTG